MKTNTRFEGKKHRWIVATLLFSVGLWASDGAERSWVALPPPRTEGGMPLMQALRERQSLRQFSDRPLADQVLSDLLWAAFGVNRPRNYKRTAPSAFNAQDVDIYLARADGLSRYEARGHRRELLLAQDIRPLTGDGGFGSDAPLVLIFVADLSRLDRAVPERKIEYAAADTGYISQNVYLFCASEGLATVVHDLTDREGLARKMGLSSSQRVILVQSVGWPKETGE